MSLKALLALEDGLILRGRSFTGPGECAGEVVFNTAMTGYQEILTDPSYSRQLVTLTFTAANNLYKRLLDAGVAKECARFVLPLATPTRIYMSGSCRSWVHYINLRSANGTQKEHMDIALECKRVFSEQFPTVAEALEWV